MSMPPLQVSLFSNNTFITCIFLFHYGSLEVGLPSQRYSIIIKRETQLGVIIIAVITEVIRATNSGAEEEHVPTEQDVSND